MQCVQISRAINVSKFSMTKKIRSKRVNLEVDANKKSYERKINQLV